MRTKDSPTKTGAYRRHPTKAKCPKCGGAMVKWAWYPRTELRYDDIFICADASCHGAFWRPARPEK